MLGFAIGKWLLQWQSEAIATNHMESNMEQRDFDELAGRIEGLARAVLILAQTVERETDMDGLTLTHQWRESVGAQPDEGSLDTARKTLHALAQQLDDARSRDQESLFQARLADPALLDLVARPRRSRVLPD
jgi:hypothetical protein